MAAAPTRTGCSPPFAMPSAPLPAPSFWIPDDEHHRVAAEEELGNDAVPVDRAGGGALGVLDPHLFHVFQHLWRGDSRGCSRHAGRDQKHPQREPHTCNRGRPVSKSVTCPHRLKREPTSHRRPREGGDGWPQRQHGRQHGDRATGVGVGTLTRPPSSPPTFQGSWWAASASRPMASAPAAPTARAVQPKRAADAERPPQQGPTAPSAVITRPTRGPRRHPRRVHSSCKGACCCLLCGRPAAPYRRQPNNHHCTRQSKNRPQSALNPAAARGYRVWHPPSRSLSPSLPHNPWGGASWRDTYHVAVAVKGLDAPEQLLIVAHVDQHLRAVHDRRL